MNRSLTFPRIRLNRYGLFIGKAGIDPLGMVLILIGAAIATTDHRWWVPLVVLALIPLVILMSWAHRLAGLEPVPERIRPLGTADELDRLRAQVDRYNSLVVDLQHMIDAAGDVPADIGLRERVDCLIRQRDGVVNTKHKRHGFEQVPKDYGG